MNFITLKELKKMVPVASEFKRVPGLKKILEDGIEVILRKQMENHAEVVVYKNGYVSYHRPQPFDWDALFGLLHKKPPRRSSYEAQLSDSDSLVTTTQIAKEYGCGAKVFNRLLHLHGIQYRANGQWVLYSEHHGKGYTSSLTFRLQRSDGSEVEKLHTAWTQKGRKFLYHTLKRRGVLPLAEQGG